MKLTDVVDLKLASSLFLFIGTRIDPAKKLNECASNDLSKDIKNNYSIECSGEEARYWYLEKSKKCRKNTCVRNLGGKIVKFTKSSAKSPISPVSQYSNSC